MKNTLQLILLFIVLTLASGCHKKFDHTPFTKTAIPSDCPLCDYADSLQGQYRGLATGFETPSNHDSLTITMEHIYLNLGNSLDSTKMFFKRIKQFDSSPDLETDTVALTSNSGIFYSGDSYNLSIIGDSMHIYDFYFDGQMPSATAILLQFDGKKLP